MGVASVVLGAAILVWLILIVTDWQSTGVALDSKPD